jgi:hypothetical protein
LQLQQLQLQVALLMQQQRRQERLLQRQQQQQRSARQQQGGTVSTTATAHNCSIGCGSLVQPVCVAGNVTIQNPCLAQCQGLAVLQRSSCTVEGEGSSAGEKQWNFCVQNQPGVDCCWQH